MSQPTVKPAEPKTENPKQFAAFVGLDWADQKHDLCLLACPAVLAWSMIHELWRFSRYTSAAYGHKPGHFAEVGVLPQAALLDKPAVAPGATPTDSPCW